MRRTPGPERGGARRDVSGPHARSGCRGDAHGLRHRTARAERGGAAGRFSGDVSGVPGAGRLHWWRAGWPRHRSPGQADRAVRGRSSRVVCRGGGLRSSAGTNAMHSRSSRLNACRPSAGQWTASGRRPSRFHAGCVSPSDARQASPWRKERFGSGSPMLARAPKPVPSPANRWPQGSEVVVRCVNPVGEFRPRQGRVSPFSL
jgi:hypothetical protein